MLQYDNLDDAQGKLLNTMCYYQGKAVYVKAVDCVYDDAFKHIDGKYRVAVLRYGDRKSNWIEMDDPEFNCFQFNIGYANHGTIVPWWYRVPKKQYSQGLKSNQMHKNCSAGNFPVAFDFTSAIVDMMENNYPVFDLVEKALKDQQVATMAFHKDFAASYDRLHDDLIIEYKGKQIGHMINRTTFKLVTEARYLEETLKEAVN